MTLRKAAVSNSLLRTLLVILPALGACHKTVHVKATSPHPVLSFAMVGTPHAIELSESIDDSFRLPRGDGLGPIQVDGWRTTIQRGFEASFDTHVNRIAPTANSTATLRLSGARLSFTASIELPKQSKATLQSDSHGLLAHSSMGHQASRPPQATIYARIDFTATVSNATEQTRSMSRIVFSEFAVSKSVTPSVAAKSAVEAMYTAIALQFFVGPPTEARAL
tara:strand:+ start:1369 stop:2034 length:666 start_codon:yes stop_codon:yes gene_type:complete